MTKILIALMIALSACGRMTDGARAAALLDDDGSAPDAPELDAAPPVDAGIDAPPDARWHIDLTATWTRTILTAGAPSPSDHRGADGVALAPGGGIVTGWEEGNIVTEVDPAGGATTVVATHVSAIEDVRSADLDGDGLADWAFCGADRCYVTFRDAPNVTVTIAPSIGRGNAIQLAITDTNGDGLPDLVVGVRQLSPSNQGEIGIYENPGILARSGAWAHHTISAAGWPMSVVPFNGRIVVSDRAYHWNPTGTQLWDLYGARWLEQTSPGVWVNHQISAPAGSCPAATPLCTTKTPGDEMFLAIDPDGLTMYDCQSAAAKTYSRIMIHRATSSAWTSWSHEVIAPVANVGHCQGVIPADVDHDGLTDLIVTTWKANAYPVPFAVAGQSGVYWLHRLPSGLYERGEIATLGGKFDNALWLAGDRLITSEQLDTGTASGGIGVAAYMPVLVP